MKNLLRSAYNFVKTLTTVALYSTMAGIDLSLFPEGPAGVYRLGHAILAREGVLLSDSAAAGETQRQMPSTLLPSPLSRALYELVLAAQPAINRLYHRVSRDEAFLEETLRSVQGDEFTLRLLELFLRTQGPRKDRPAAGILRSDYMQHGEGMKQVEVNTISVSLATISQRVERAHRDTAAMFNRSVSPPANEAADRTAELLALARDEYIRTVPDSRNPAVLFCASSNEPNLYDQSYTRVKLVTSHRVPFLVRSLRELEGTAVLREGRLFVAETEVCVCYYRYGYRPADYSEQAWEIRALMEGSRALQIPDIAMQLCGTKRMQQRLTDPAVIDRFLWDSSREDRERLNKLFAKQFSLAPSPEGDRMAREAESCPDAWVLKPQREGGGNNYFRQEMVDKLKSLEGLPDRGAYILMERLRPPGTPNYLLSPGQNTDRLELTETVQEVGIYGMYIARGDLFSHDVTAGYLLRSKDSRTEDGGVGAGRAYMDSLTLVD